MREYLTETRYQRLDAFSLSLMTAITKNQVAHSPAKTIMIHPRIVGDSITNVWYAINPQINAISIPQVKCVPADDVNS